MGAALTKIVVRQHHLPNPPQLNSTQPNPPQLNPTQPNPTQPNPPQLNRTQVIQAAQIVDLTSLEIDLAADSDNNLRARVFQIYKEVLQSIWQRGGDL